MRSKRSFFSSRIFVRDLTRMWPVWAVMLLVLILLMPVWLSNSLNSSRELIYIPENLLDASATAYGVVAFFSGIICAMCVFSYMYSSKSAVMFSSLPLRREGLFLSGYTAGLVGQIVVNIITMAITVAVALSHGWTAGVPYVFTCLGVMCIYTVFFYSLATLCAMLTGNLLILPCVYVIFNVVAWSVEQVVDELLGSLLYGFVDMASNKTLAFSPIVNIMYNRVFAVSELTGNDVLRWRLEGIIWLYCLLAAGIVMAAAALLIFRRRRVESASDIVALRVLKPVFRWCMALGGAICIGAVIYYAAFPKAHLGLSFPSILFSLLVGCAIGWFGAEMLIRKSFRVLKGSYKGFIICVLLVTAVTVVLRTDALGFEHRTPKAERIEEVEVMCGGENTIVTEPEEIERVLDLHRAVAEEKDIQMQRQGSDLPWDGPSFTLRLRYHLKDGGDITRKWRVVTLDTDDALYRMTDELLNSTEAILDRNALPDKPNLAINAWINVRDTTWDNQGEYVLGGDEAGSFYYDCILPDMQDRLLGRVSLIGEYEQWLKEPSESQNGTLVEIRLESTYFEDGDSYRDYTTLYLLPEAYRTIEFLFTKEYLK